MVIIEKQISIRISFLLRFFISLLSFFGLTVINRFDFRSFVTHNLENVFHLIPFVTIKHKRLPKTVIWACSEEFADEYARYKYIYYSFIVPLSRRQMLRERLVLLGKCSRT